MLKRWISITVAAAALAMPATAQSATVSFTGNVLIYTAAPGESNNLSLAPGTEAFQCDPRPAPCLQLQEVGGPISSTSARCTTDGTGFAKCDAPASIVANLGDRDDAMFDWGGPSTINGGPGNDPVLQGNGGADAISGGPGNDVLFGGDGNDVLDGGDGNDTLEGFRGLSPENQTEGTDTYIGGPGADAVDYGGRTENLSISIDGVANDGAAGEGDNVGVDVEGVRGGESADTLTGSGAANLLDGWNGNDEVHGGGGEDALFGGSGDDRTFGGDGQDTIEGGDGSDLVDGGPGIDELHGDEVQVCIPVDCATGRDTIAAQDGFDDTVTCGPGEDSATLDAGDRIPASGQDVCERVVRGSSPQQPIPGLGGAGGGGGAAPGGGVPTAAADVTVPLLTDLRMGDVRGGRSVKVRYKLSEAAQVTFMVQRRIQRRGTVRWVKVRGTFRQQGRAGANERSFDGRLQGRRLKRGRYRLSAVARDGAGNQARAKRVEFRVLR